MLFALFRDEIYLSALRDVDERQTKRSSTEAKSLSFVRLRELLTNKFHYVCKQSEEHVIQCPGHTMTSRMTSWVQDKTKNLTQDF